MPRTIPVGALSFVFCVIAFIPAPAVAQPRLGKLGALAHQRAAKSTGWSHVIIQAVDTDALTKIAPAITEAGGTAGAHLRNIDAREAYLPNAALAALADHPLVSKVWLDREVEGATERTGAAIGAVAVRQQLGYDGAGVGVAVIDSGVTAWHDDLGTLTGGQRIERFVDLVKGRTTPYDDYGHGTHTAGIVAGNGYHSGGARTGIAPAAHLVIIKVLDDRGKGRVSRVIAALDYVVTHKDALNIRIVNLSLAAAAVESYDTDPLTLAAKRAVDAGLVVVAAAGNAGRDPQGRTQYGAIAAPGNAPWVLTVGASSHMGTIDRTDDTVAVFSSRGPGALDYRAKPDIVAPGVGIESLSDPRSALYTTHSAYLLAGSFPATFLPYLSLSGTSMSAPVVSGTVALMLQANPALTPNQIKAILQYTAASLPGHDPLTQGAGLLNARGAVELARFFASPLSAYPSTSSWGLRVIWGNYLVEGGRLMPNATAWAADVVWGATATPRGERITWGTACDGGDCSAGALSQVPWDLSCAESSCSSLTSATARLWNVVWGNTCGGTDCTAGADADETVVWGSTFDETVVWGSNLDETVVWGSTDQDTVVWGSGCSDPACVPVIWNKDE